MCYKKQQYNQKLAKGIFGVSYVLYEDDIGLCAGHKVAVIYGNMSLCISMPSPCSAAVNVILALGWWGSIEGNEGGGCVASPGALPTELQTGKRRIQQAPIS